MNDIIPTPQEFTLSMLAIISGDEEMDHIEMDQLMVDLLRQLGYDDAMTVFESCHKWYA